jgi:hypothetical protein
MKILLALFILAGSQSAFSQNCQTQIDAFIKAQNTIAKSEIGIEIDSSIIAEDSFAFAKALNQMTDGVRKAITPAIENATMNALSNGSAIVLVNFYPSRGDHNYWCIQGVDLLVLDSKSCVAVHEQQKFDCK